MNEPFSLQPSDESQRTMALAAYALFGLGIFFYALVGAGILFGGLPTIAGVILAYIKRPDMEGTAYYDHMCFLIRTFWGSLAGFVLGMLFVFVFVGIFLIWAVAIWYTFRVIYGAVKCYEYKSVTPVGWFM